MQDTVGKRIRAYRKLKHLTQQEFAQLLGISVGLLGSIERGTKQPPESLLKPISELLQVSIEDLTREETTSI